MKKLLTIVVILLASYASFAISPVEGILGTCVGSSTPLTDTLSLGGTWSSSVTAVATIGITTGIVSGITPGTTIITYTLGGSYVTAVFQVSNIPDAITGITSFCSGTTSLLSDATTGGTWSSYYSGIATVSTGGVVTGGVAGSTEIYYTVGTGCAATTTVTISATSAGAISGVDSICRGSSTIFSDYVSGGIWSSSNTSMATVGSTTGIVSGISDTSAIISYSVSGACGTTVTTKRISILTMTDASAIGGVTSEYVGTNSPVWDYAGNEECTSSYTWSSSNTATATILPGVGYSAIISGIAPGTTIITYTAVGCSGPLSTSMVFTVLPMNRISGNVLFTGSTYNGPLEIWLIKYNPGTNLLEQVSSQTINTGGLSSVYYEFLGASSDSFRVKANAVNADSSVTGYIPTYHTSSFYWHDANVFYHTFATIDDGMNINMAYGTTSIGPGFISGNVTLGANRGTSGTVPAIGLLMIAETSTGNTIQQAYTDGSGNYSFSNLPLGTYTIHPEDINYISEDYTGITLTTSAPSTHVANFIQHTVSHTITPGTTGINTVNPQTSSITAFPNPTTGKLNIQWQETATENGTVTICDITGRQIYKTTVNMTQGSGVSQIDLSGLSNGLYLISVRSGSVNYNNKIKIKN